MDDQTAHQAAMAMLPEDAVHAVRVTFVDGQEVVGKVSSWGSGGFVPQVTLLRLSAGPRDADPHTVIRWESVASVEVTFHDGTVKTVP